MPAEQPNTTRRALFAGAALAAATPAAAFSLTGPSINIDPDAELGDLGRKYDALVERRAVLAAEIDRLDEVFEEIRPHRPDTLKVRHRDWLVLGLSAHSKVGSWLGSDQCQSIERRLELSKTAHPLVAMRPGDVARGEEVVSAHKAWAEVYQARRDACGLTAAELRADELDSAIYQTSLAAAATRARTIAGLKIKARMLRDNSDVDEQRWFYVSPEHLNGLMADLLQADA